MDSMNDDAKHAPHFIETITIKNQTIFSGIEHRTQTKKRFQRDVKNIMNQYNNCYHRNQIIQRTLSTKRKNVHSFFKLIIYLVSQSRWGGHKLLRVGSPDPGCSVNPHHHSSPTIKMVEGILKNNITYQFLFTKAIYVYLYASFRRQINQEIKRLRYGSKILNYS